MPRRSLVSRLVSLIGPLLLSVAALPCPAVAGSFAVQGDHFTLAGKPWLIRSGELHYPRVPKAAWRDRMRKMRAMGLNTLSTYIFWNLHEATPGVYDFSGQLNIREFIETAAEEGLKVILRPGPYVCAEWEFGGFPAWLLKAPQVAVRQDDPRFLTAASRYLARVGAELKGLGDNDHGPIILVQVENEYGSFGTDHGYMDAIRKAVEEAGFNAALYTGDSVWERPGVQQELSYGTFPDLPVAINFGLGVDIPGALAAVDTFRPGGPKMVGEYWTGWFDHPGLPHATRSAEAAAAGLDLLLQRGVSFNLYMAQGGTSFGFMNGANWELTGYEPDTTSYDYDAPIDEAGRPTAKFALFRSVIQKHLAPGEVLPPLPAAEPLVSIPAFHFTEQAALDQLLVKPVTAPQPLAMEDLDQAYGFVLYRHQMTEAYQGLLQMPQVRDYAVVMQGSSILGTLDRRSGDTALPVALTAGSPLDVLVENMGRINFSTAMVGERKGLLAPVATGDGRELSGWQMYRLPLTDLSGLQFTPAAQGQTLPAFYRAHFALQAVGDTFIDTRGWGKGVVFVNGHNLGRYWSVGPQVALFCPGSWLHAGSNEVVVFELETPASLSMQGLNGPYYQSMAPRVKVKTKS